jgi:hypothetical protein
VFVPEELAGSDANQGVGLHVVPLKCLFVVPAGVFGVVAQQFVGRSHIEFVLFGLVDIVDDECHAHVSIEVYQFFTHFSLHLSDHVVQFATRKAILKFKLVGQLGFSK